jgi:hypothetical protein
MRPVPKVIQTNHDRIRMSRDLTTPALLRPMWSLLTLFCMGLAYLALASAIDPGADTLWRLHIAEGLLQGKVLYRDMIEVNPPLWFWAAMPSAALGGYPAVVGFNLISAVIALVLCHRISRWPATPQRLGPHALGWG